MEKIKNVIEEVVKIATWVLVEVIPFANAVISMFKKYIHPKVK